MSEVHRYQVVTMLSAAGATIGYDPHGPDVVMAAEFYRVTAERDALRNEAGQVKGEYDRAVNKVDVLQALLTAADERADVSVGLLREARQHHGVMLMSDPPQDAWKYHCMNERIDAVLNAKP
ncbi:hypothetical protein [Pseudomonas sp. 22072]|uniref:hypothetical protein n=1 Tax=Pseudomonas sp. 22072 TaxID=3453865 RepID=UPI003F85B947